MSGVLVIVFGAWFGYVLVGDRVPPAGEVEPGPLVFVLSVGAGTTLSVSVSLAWTLGGVL